ncbi:TIGR03643 family protein [Porticoccaceae bacterium]|nr:TIGR03643 family protein [Porticoccaceae bacterium]MDC0011589.1 TIGR03643 family protein [Porticoccaceae bacterium]MDC1453509.1 TIGR03643 family protein [Porticoccaceae bacterium]
MANSSSQLNSSIDAASVAAVTALTDSEVSRVIEMAWEDRTPFEAIEGLFKLNESAVISLMRRTMKPRSFRLWRKRVTGRKTKHLQLRSPDVSRGYCPTQYKRG